MSEMNPGAGLDESAKKQELETLRALLELSTALTAAGDEVEIVRHATAAVPSLCDCRTVAIHLDGAWLPEATLVPDPPVVEARLATLGPSGGPMRLPGVGWARAYPLAGPAGMLGHLVVAADAEPDDSQQVMVGLLAQQAASALANARMHKEEQTMAARETAIAEELSTTNAALERSVHAAESAREALQRRLDVHDRLTYIAVAGGGADGIAQAVHQLTGLPVAIEDRFGTPVAWAGPDRPEPYPKAGPGEREELIRAALSRGRPLRCGDRVVAVAQDREEVLGVIALVDPGNTWADVNRGALEHGATTLALELAHLRSVAEVELRLGRDLVEELLTGSNLDGILERFRAIGYDFDRPHRVVVVMVTAQRGEGDRSFQAVRRAARDTGVGSLLVARAGRLAVLSGASADWEAFRLAIVAELGSGGGCRVGIGGPCRAPADFTRSHREALLALNVQASVGAPDRVSVFDDLGVYRLLSESADVGSVERFVQRWLGALTEYDGTKGAELVRTLTSYLESGGNYNATASMLSIHRSSVRYRLGRIRHISGHDLADADTRFNLQFATRAWSTILAMRGA
jgi:sugar diacid utilization regulator